MSTVIDVDAALEQLRQQLRTQGDDSDAELKPASETKHSRAEAEADTAKHRHPSADQSPNESSGSSDEVHDDSRAFKMSPGQRSDGLNAHAHEKSNAPLFQDTRISPTDTDIQLRRRYDSKGEILEDEGDDINLFRQTDVHRRVKLRFENICYEVKLSKKLSTREKAVKKILKGVSGKVTPGSLLAIMGSSGAGKTMLLNILAGRLSAAGNGRTSGQILLNGKKRHIDTFSRVAAYVLQDDIFFAELTVHETITLSAQLRLGADVGKGERKKRVDSIIRELGLSRVKDDKVGSQVVRGVSGGERKRVNIGTELITNPSLIFLDEPTSGLDSFNARNVVDNLLQLARGGRTILTTLHQPRSEIYSSLDKLLLMSEGYALYMGDARQATEDFSRIGYRCPQQHNPGDYFLDIASPDNRNEERARQTSKRIQYFAEMHKDRMQSHPLPSLGENVSDSQRQAFEQSKTDAKYATGWWMQFALLFQRAFIIMLRERATNIARFTQVIVFSILLSLIWLNEAEGNNAANVQAIAGVIFFLLINQSFGAVFQIVYTFPEEQGVINKERAAHSYRVSTYFLSKTFVELPRSFLAVLLFSSILYPVVSLRWGADYFFRFVLAVFLSALAAESISYLVSAISKTSQQAGSIAPIFIISAVLFSGFFISVEDIPIWLRWLQYLSFIRYAFMAVLINEFEGRAFDTSACSTSTFCPATGDEVLDIYDADEFTYAQNLLFLIALSIFFRAIAYVAVLKRGPVFDTSL